MKARYFLPYVCVLLLASPVLARADEASKASKIEEMLTLTHADRMIPQMLDQLRPMIDAQISKLELPEDARPAAEEMQKRMLDLVASKLSWEKMKPLYIKVYAESLTEEEITGVVEFYKTPAGQALLNKLPVIIQKSMALSQEMMGDLMPEISKMSEDLARKYRK
jgi:uncharacterized protein